MTGSVEAEKLILGALLLDNGTYSQAVEYLPRGADHFSVASTRAVFSAVSQLVEENEEANPVTVCDRLRAQGVLDEIGGAAFVGSLVTGTPFLSDIESYCRLVVAKWKRGELAKIASRALNEAIDDSLGSQADADEIAARTCDELSRLTSSTDVAKPENAGAIAERRVAAYEELAAQSKLIRGLQTGFPSLDYAISGLTSTLIYVAARPSVGKTSFACSLANLCSLQASNGNPVILFFSIESSKETITDRLLAQRCQVDSFRMRHGMISKSEWRAVLDAQAQLAQSRIIIDDRTHLTVPVLKAVASRIQREYGRLDLILIDYVQRMHPAVYRQGQSRANELQQISVDLQGAQKSLNVPIVGFLQLSREVEKRADKRPLLSDLRESGSFEQDGRVILALHREKVYDPDADNRAEIILLKNNEGVSGITVEAEFVPQLSAFVPAAQGV